MKQSEERAEADVLIEGIKKRIKALPDTNQIKKKMHAHLASAEELLARADTDAALESLRELQEKIGRTEESIEAEPIAWRLLALEVGYLVALLALAYFTYRRPDIALWANMVTVHTQAAWFGALGGTTIALYGLYTHVQKRDFDRGYALWYVCKPILGAIFGWFAFLIYYVGIISVQPLDTASVAVELPFLIAFLAGFSERFVLRLIDRLMSVLLAPGAEKEEEQKEKTGKKETTGKS
ncbi:MAG: hypothetical protein ACM3ON_09590 [Chloroflexota bacterium]